MSGTFPAFAALQPTPLREGPLYQVKADIGLSGVEVRTVMGESSGARYRYRLEIILQNALGEVDDFIDFVDLQYGSGDSFDFTDWIDGTARVGRFDGAPSLTQYQGVDGWWKASMAIYSVIT
jgi:hypothetical protein